MNSRLLSFGVVASLIAVSVPVALALTPPAWIDEEYRTCTFDAIDREMELRIEAERRYGEENVRDLEEYREDLRRAWDIADERARRDELRAADRRYRDASRETDRSYGELTREIRNASREAQRECRNRFNDHKRFTRDMCVSTADCRSNQVCTTERGACEPSCPPDAESCIQVCAGTCERAPRSSSSRSSSSRSSSSSSSFGFPAPSSSSRSSLPGGGGFNCQPWVCPDGREFPSCNEDGYPINYIQNPCYS